MDIINDEDSLIVLGKVDENIGNQFMDDITALWLKYDQHKLMSPEKFATLLIHHGTSLLYHMYGAEAVLEVFNDTVEAILEEQPELN
jgi:hypothetical protein